MSRLLPALTAVAVAVACGVLSGAAHEPERPTPTLIGADTPVDLGQMVVTATPL